MAMTGVGAGIGMGTTAEADLMRGGETTTTGSLEKPAAGAEAPGTSPVTVESAAGGSNVIGVTMAAAGVDVATLEATAKAKLTEPLPR